MKSVFFIFILCLGFKVTASPYSKEVLSSTNFTASDLKELITSKNITTIEDLIPELPKSYLEGYTLAYASRSLQGASFLNPRAILFGSDANLVMTFNGSAVQNNFNNLEIMEFDKTKKVFTFQDIEFQKGTPAKFSQKNPESCLKCHGQDPKPIWEGYPLWAGIYGSANDSLSVTEKKYFSLYREAAKTHPRYKYLVPSTELGSATPDPKANLKLTHLLGRLNLQRISRKITEIKSLYPYRYLMAAAGLKCSIPNTKEMPNAFPEMNSARIQIFQRAADNLKIPLTQYVYEGDYRFVNENGMISANSSISLFNREYQGILSQFWSIDTTDLADWKNWSMASFPTPQLDFHYGYYGLNALGFYIANDWFDAVQDQDLLAGLEKGFKVISSSTLTQELNYFTSQRKPITESYANFYNESGLCRKILEKSNAALANYSPNWSLTSETKKKNALSTCIACHTNPVEGIRQIPFDSVEELKAELKKEGVYGGENLGQAITKRLYSKENDHMPKFGYLNDKDKKAIIEYIEKLQKD